MGFSTAGEEAATRSKVSSDVREEEDGKLQYSRERKEESLEPPTPATTLTSPIQDHKGIKDPSHDSFKK